MANNWLDVLVAAQKTAIVQDGRKKIHYTFSDGTELAEEYDAASLDLLVRKWRRKGALGQTRAWDYEVGEAPALRGDGSAAAEGLLESASNPVLLRRDARDAFQWRIRNLPYPPPTYGVTVEEDCIVIRTTNKKYYKRLRVPDLERLSIKPSSQYLSHTHANNTLIVTYKKPAEVVAFEKKLAEELRKVKSVGDGDTDCKTQ